MKGGEAREGGRVPAKRKDPWGKLSFSSSIRERDAGAV